MVRVENKSPEEVIKTFGLHRANIYKWLAAYDAYGFDGLKSTKAKGPTPKLTEKQKKQLTGMLLKNPLQLQFEYALWTIDMITELISRKFSVNYSKVQVGRLMKKLGLSRQRPLERAIQQDPQKVQDWLNKAYPAIRKEAKKGKREIYFSDEAGFHATAQYGSTWAKRGETPIIKTSGKREKVNVISAINNKGKLRFMLYETGFNSDIFLQFLKRLLHNQKAPVTLIVDGHKSHFTKPVKEFVSATKGRLKIYQLPPYSPELNPDELVWNNAKQKVAKAKHTPSKKTFKEKVKSVMDEIKQNTILTKAFFNEPNVAYAM
ncbi:MAG: IS630 family transposase [Bacteroidota bacterium]|nr:IS630 family transposase [Bacteroidota bacterium]